MKVIYTVADLRSALATHKGEQIGFVPTMGALHAGHLSLVERARKECGVVVVSIFVNPTQFNDKGDLAAYPRTLPADLELLSPIGPDYVFAPSVEEVYPTPDTREFDFGMVDKVMEGASRPGHFNGVGQVVSKLFDFVEPHKAYFGEKDFQQIAVIKELVRQMGSPVEIVECPIVRDTDGLALSSRNTLLDEAHRAAAPHIYATLRKAVERKAEFASPAEMVAWVEEEINKNPLLKCIYFEVVDALSMQSVAEWTNDCNTQGCIAVQCGSVRLIDNIKV
ncbi:MAG: pantoate--beta-alanine ligase [Tidjanibacter sp.]|nr:pantoate--beta-alanine ligase [Tidjanibacter sp.]MBQ6604812.1 pantoate--beta-alanine ligase [Tidjanibacter sp.]